MYLLSIVFESRKLLNIKVLYIYEGDKETGEWK